MQGLFDYLQKNASIFKVDPFAHLISTVDKEHSALFRFPKNEKMITYPLKGDLAQVRAAVEADKTIYKELSGKDFLKQFGVSSSSPEATELVEAAKKHVSHERNMKVNLPIGLGVAAGALIGKGIHSHVTRKALAIEKAKMIARAGASRNKKIALGAAATTGLVGLASLVGQKQNK